MRHFLPSLGLAALLLAGCGNDDDNIRSSFNVEGLPQPSPVDAGVSLNPQNALREATVLLKAVHVNGGGPEVSGQPLAFIEAGNPLAVAETIQASYGALLARGSGTIAGSGGGTAVSTVNGTSISLTLSGFSTGDGAVSGTVLYNGGNSTTGFTSNSTISGLTASPLNGSRPYSLDGGGTYASTRTATGGIANVFGSNATVSDPSNGGLYRYVNFVTSSNVTPQTTPSGSGGAAQSGRLLFSSFRSLNGFVDVSTPQLLRFSDDVVTAGQWLFAGSGSIRATVIGPNSVSLEAAPVGGVFTPVQVIDYATIEQGF